MKQLKLSSGQSLRYLGVLILMVTKLFQIDTPAQAVSVLCQTTLALAAAEKQHSFEHRDLHAGNVLVFTKAEPRIHEYVLYHEDAKHMLNLIRAIVDGYLFRFYDHAISARLIDFTLARFEYKGNVYFYDFRLLPLQLYSYVIQFPILILLAPMTRFSKETKRHITKSIDR